jgi:hypothetical protein
VLQYLYSQLPHQVLIARDHPFDCVQERQTELMLVLRQSVTEVKAGWVRHVRLQMSVLRWSRAIWFHGGDSHPSHCDSPLTEYAVPPRARVALDGKPWNVRLSGGSSASVADSKHGSRHHEVVRQHADARGRFFCAENHKQDNALDHTMMFVALTAVLQTASGL